MSTYVYYIFRQLIHYLKHLDLRLKIELFIFLAILCVFFSEQSSKLLTMISDRSNTSTIGITILLEHIFFLLFAITTPFINHFLLPRQHSIHVLRILPLKKEDVFFLLFGNYLKYQVLFLLPIIPLFISIISVFNILYALHFLFSLGLCLILLFLLGFSAYRSNQKTLFIFGLYFLIIVLYTILSGITYWLGHLYWLLQLLLLIIGCIVLGIVWWDCWKDWISFLDRAHIYIQKNKSKPRNNWYSGRHFLPSRLNALFLKEILSYMRNPHYLRVKLFGYLIYASIMFGMQPILRDDYLAASTVFTIFYIWIHYTHQFNEKYVHSESRFFIKTMYFKYHQIWSAKFGVETIFMLPILIIFIVALIIYGVPADTLLTMSVVAFMIALFVLATIVTVRLLFYDNTRFAGYAYHFMVIFSFLMIGNFYLVGPLVSFILIGYLGFLSYRQFSR